MKKEIAPYLSAIGVSALVFALVLIFWPDKAVKDKEVKTGDQLFIELKNINGWGEIYTRSYNVNSISRVSLDKGYIEVHFAFNGATAKAEWDSFPINLNQTFIEWLKKHTLYAK